MATNSTLNATSAESFAFEFEDEYDWVKDLLAGIGILLIPVLAAPPYSLILKLFIKDKELSVLSAFRIMTYLGVCDFTLMFGALFCGIALVTNTDAPKLLVNVTGTLMNMSWHSYMFLVMLLSFNRVLTSLQKHKLLLTWFSPKATNTLCALCFLPGILFAAGTIWIDRPAYFYRSYYVLLLEVKADDQKGDYGAAVGVFSLVDQLYTAVTMLVTMCCYLVLFCYIKKKMKQSASTVGASANANAARKRENVVAVQACLISLCTVGCVALWYIPPLLGIRSLPFTYLTLASWFFNAAVNPIIYLSFNKTIKTKFTKELPIKLQKLMSSTKVTATSNTPK